MIMVEAFAHDGLGDVKDVDLCASARVAVTAAMMPSWSMPVTVRIIFTVFSYCGLGLRTQ